MKQSLVGKKVLFLGARRNAIRAAHELGIEPIVFCKTDAPASLKKLCKFFKVLDFQEDSPRFSEKVIESLNGQSFDAVVGLTEGSVLHAAILRERSHLGGMDYNQSQKCRNKFLMKQNCLAAGIRCTPFRRIDSQTSFEDIKDHLRTPFLIKETNSSGGRGFSFVRNKNDFEKNRYDNHMAEAYIYGREFSVESFISNGKIVFQNISEYLIPGWSNIVPYQLDEAQKIRIHEFSSKVIQAFGMDRGMIHLEAFLSTDGLIFNELAIRPPGGYIMDLMRATYGFCPWKLYLKCELGIEVKVIESQVRAYHGVLMIHPAPGALNSIEGLDEILQREDLVRLRLKCRPGDFIHPRLGTGQNKGYLIVRGQNRETVFKSIKDCNQLLKFS